MTDSDEYLLMSGIQHFAFCRRQWALIHLEQQWAENLRTAEGRLDHKRCHDDTLAEKRGDLLTVRGMRVVSHRLRLSGVCDVVELRVDPNGITLQDRDGKWLPTPVEYKHGHAKEIDADRLQLCAQAMALEEMLACDVPQGVLYYAETHRREVVPMTQELRDAAQSMADEMNAYYVRGYTPQTKPAKHCNACSLKELCLPVLYKRADPEAYLRSHIDEEASCDIC